MRKGIIVTILLLITALISHAATSFYLNRDKPNATDIGFAQDMAIHHAQALDIAAYVMSSKNPIISAMAYKIYHAQSREIGRFYGWLEAWGQPLITSQEMAWIKMPGKHDEFKATPMDMGMASPEEMQQLASRQSEEQDILFLQLMIRHHQGGVYMASLAHQQANTHLVKGVTQLMAAEQVKEIMQMVTILRQENKQPLSYPANWRNWKAVFPNP